MEKTTLMLLIEERAGKEIREVIAAAIEQGQTLAGACDVMREQYRAAPSPQVLLSWIDDLGGEVIKRVQWRVEWDAQAAAGAVA
jgi:hypothetical protein